MKKNLVFITILLMLTACINTNPIISPKLITQNPDESGGGNPEVYIAHKCLKSKSAQTCLEKLFSDERKVYLESYNVIKLASRGASVEMTTIKIKGDDLFLLYLDTSNITKPLHINIESTKVSKDNNSMLFMIPVNAIDNDIIIKEINGDIVLHYKVLKQ